MKIHNTKLSRRQNEVNTSFQNSVTSIIEVYQAAMIGYKHQMVQISGISKKLGSKKGENILNKDEFKEMKEMLDLKDSNSKIYEINITNNEEKLLKKALGYALKNAQKIPKIARSQSVISFFLAFEVFVADTIRNIYENNPSMMKSEKTSLKDDELIELIQRGDILVTLREKLVRTIMFGSVKKWNEFLQKVGLKITLPKIITEFSLVRNSLVHNNQLVSAELEKIVKRPRYKVGTEINITDLDIIRYEKAIREYSRKGTEEVIKKFE